MYAEANNNNDFGYNPDPSDSLGSASDIMRHGYRAKDGTLWLDVKMGGRPYRVSFEDARSDMPRKLALYIQEKRIDTRGRACREPYHKWATEFPRALERVIQRLTILQGSHNQRQRW